MSAVSQIDPLQKHSFLRDCTCGVCQRIEQTRIFAPLRMSWSK